MRNEVATNRRTALGLGLTLVLATIGSGCGNADPGKPKLGKVNGKVTYNGKPVTSGTVTFTPEATKGGATGQGALGQISADGSYDLTTFDTGDGAILGQHIVTVVSYSDPNYGKPKPDGTYDYKLPKPAIPEKYTKVDQSPLRCTVEEGSKTFAIEMKD